MCTRPSSAPCKVCALLHEVYYTLPYYPAVYSTRTGIVRERLYDLLDQKDRPVPLQHVRAHLSMWVVVDRFDTYLGLRISCAWELLQHTQRFTELCNQSTRKGRVGCAADSHRISTEHNLRTLNHIHTQIRPMSRLHDRKCDCKQDGCNGDRQLIAW